MLDIRTGFPAEEASLHRARVLKLFGIGAGRSKAIETMVAMHMLPNGDWRDCDSMVVLAPSDIRAKHSDDVLKSTIAYGLEYCLARSAPPLYKRHRWLAMDITLDTHRDLVLLPRPSR